MEFLTARPSRRRTAPRSRWPARPAGHRREPVEVHVSRHGHLHRRVDGHGDVVVIDPGPRLDSIATRSPRRSRASTVRAILVTHCHADHSPLAAWLAPRPARRPIAYGPHGDEPGTSATTRWSTNPTRTEPSAGADGPPNRSDGGVDRLRLRARRRGRRRRCRGRRLTGSRSPPCTRPATRRTTRVGRSTTDDAIAVHRRSRDGVEHHGGVAARRRHGRVHRVAARWSPGARRCAVPTHGPPIPDPVGVRRRARRAPAPT